MTILDRQNELPHQSIQSPQTLPNHTSTASAATEEFTSYMFENTGTFSGDASDFLSASLSDIEQPTKTAINLNSNGSADPAQQAWQDLYNTSLQELENNPGSEYWKGMRDHTENTLLAMQSQTNRPQTPASPAPQATPADEPQSITPPAVDTPEVKPEPKPEPPMTGPVPEPEPEAVPVNPTDTPTPTPTTPVQNIDPDSTEETDWNFKAYGMMGEPRPIATPSEDTLQKLQNFNWSDNFTWWHQEPGSINDLVELVGEVTDLPPEMLYGIMIKESEGNPFITGPSGSQDGLLQVQKPTWDLVIEQNKSNLDTLGVSNPDRNDTMHQAVVGALYLRDMKQFAELQGLDDGTDLTNWAALGGYNAGPGWLNTLGGMVKEGMTPGQAIFESKAGKDLYGRQINPGSHIYYAQKYSSLYLTPAEEAAGVKAGQGEAGTNNMGPTSSQVTTNDVGADSIWVQKS